MNTRIVLSLLLMGLVISDGALAALYTATGLPAIIPDNNPNGYQNSLVVSGVLGPIAGVTVTLDITGGFNGDLYVALDYNNSSAVLLNRVGLSAGSSVSYTACCVSTCQP